MTWSFTAHRGNANNKVSGAVLTVNPSAQVDAGAILVAVCASDNVATAGGESKTHIVADFLGNPWQKVIEWTNAAAAAAGITGSVWLTRVRRAITTADPVVFGLRSAAAAKCIGLYQYALSPGSTARLVSVVGNEQDNTASPTVTMSGLNDRQYAFLGVAFREADTANTFNQDADYNNRTSFGTTGGTGNTNVSCIVGDRVLTGTGDTFAPTALSASADCVTVLLAMQEIPLAQPSFATNDSTLADLQDAVREAYRQASPTQIVRLAQYVESLNLSDAQLQSLFGVTAAQTPGIRARISNQASLYEALAAQGGQ